MFPIIIIFIYKAKLIIESYLQKNIHRLLTTNINFNAWDDIFYDHIIANAILDRILHHAHVVSITGNSYRLKDTLNFEENVNGKMKMS